MRVHRLQITGFGPFVDTQDIDFDGFNDAGLFLLTGGTGAGKTSVLDAICFGLFGAVPGVRNSARDLKSHHAAPDAVPVVVLETTIRGRRFRFTRSPAWTRPSRRARSGVVEVAAKATIAEWADGSWQPLSNRVDEVGQLVTRVLGMNREQFCQVVLLPQGQFQAFLRAGAKERHDVLESLFETHRFRAVEAWLAEHRRSVEAAQARAESRLRDVLARLSEVEGEVADSADHDRAHHDWADHDWADHDWAGWVSAFAEKEQASAIELELLRQRYDDAHDAAKQAQHDLDTGRRLHDLQDRYLEAIRHLKELDSLEPAVAERRELVDKARQAERFAGLLRFRDDARQRLRRAQAELQTALVPTPVDDRHPLTAEEAGQAADRCRRELGRLHQLLDDERRLQSLLLDQENVAADIADLHATVERVGNALRAGRARLAELDAQATQANQAAAELPRLRQETQLAETTVTAAAKAAELHAQVAAAEARAEQAAEAHLQARANWLELRERYLDGVSAALARTLAEGSACPVCGSVDHPSPAQPREDHVDRDVERAAQGVTSAAETAAADASRQLGELQTALASAEAAAGGADVAQATARCEQARGRLMAAEREATGAEELTKACAELQAGLDDAEGELRRSNEAEIRAAEKLTNLVSQTAELRLRLNAAVEGEFTVQFRIGEVEEDLHQWQHLMQLTGRVDQLCDTIADLQRQAEALLNDSEFSTLAQVEAARLPAAEVAAMDALNRGYDSDVAANRRQLDDPNLVEASRAPAPRLADLEQTARAAVESAARQSARFLAAEGRLERLRVLLEELREGVRDLAPITATAELAAEVASFCAGTAADNSTKTKLSHYVLAARLEQVVAAANHQLGAICGGRYQLEHSMQKSVGDTRGGLSLRVLDTYTGQRRDPATLSGGETFYVSLALALGLADLVGNETGGAELSTLFVDEGFGSLDADTLDEVMDTLDELRSGGRCVGVVSHLAELQMRIPTQLRISRTPTGARIAVP